MRYSNFILFVLFLIGSRAFALDILRVNTMNDRDGLSQNTVRCMMQDSRGFMWLGTINGLNRYDGREFITIQPRPDFPQTLRDNRISSISEDSNGYIWVHTFSDMLLCYNPRTEVFIDYAPENTTKIFSSIKMASNGDVWLWGEQGICRVRHENGKLHSWTPNTQALTQQPVTFVFEDSSGKIWFSDDNELFRVSGNTVTTMLKGTAYSDAHQLQNRLYFVSANHIIAFDLHKQTFLSPVSIPEPTTHLYSCLLNDGLILIAAKNTVYAFDSHTMHISSAERFFEGKKLRSARFISDNKGNVWLYNASGVLWKHCEGNTFKPLRLISSEILSISQRERYQIYHDSHDIIWISTFGNGLFAFNSDGKQISHFTAGKDLPTNYLFCVIEDTSGEIWVGTELAGVTKISRTNYPFDIFYPNSDSDNDRDNAVRLIYEDTKGRYWFGTRDGYLHVCDSLLHSIYKHQIAGGIPFSITEDSQGNKWVGTKGAGLLVFDADGKHKLQTYRLNDGEKQVSSSNNIFTIMTDTKGRMWIASFGGGLHLVEKLTENDVRFRQIRMKNSQQNMMRSMIQDADGMIWVGTNDGLVIFDPDAIIKDEESYITLNPNTQNWQSPNSNEVRVVFEDSRKRIWIGTTGGGLNLLVREKPLSNSRFKHYGVENGLSNEMIQAIQEDDNGHIWISTENGISKFDFRTELFENFSFSSSRNTTVFSELSCWKKKNGELMFGSYNGVYIFAPAEITYDTYSPPVVITGLRINGSVVSAGDPNSPLTESITSTKTIFLKYNQNSFNLEYTMLNFHAPEYNQYIYYLEGYETDWNSISRSNIATYRNLPPGNYHFKIKGCNSFGIWSNLETDLQIVITPPWWKSGWAWLAYFILASILVYFASKLILKIYQLNTAVKVEKQLTEYKLRFFTNISHEFRTPLTIIRGSIENLSAQKDLPSVVSKQINTLAKSSARLLRLVEQLLEFRRLQNDKMELILEHTEAHDFFRDIWQTFRDMAEKKGIEYIFECNVTERAMLLDKGKMDKIVYNLLSNAFKHTPIGGKIAMKLCFSDTNDMFTLSISDSGPGIPPEQRNMLFVRFKQINYTSDGVGVGLHLTSELTKVHKGNIVYSESEWGGACFSVSVPLSDKNYDKANIIGSSQSSERFVTTIDVEQSAVAEAELIDASVDKPFKDYKVMIVEDSDEVRGFIEDELGKYFSVVSACNGAEALEKVTDEQPDIVVCDVMMPEMNGYEFTKRMKKNFESSHIPVILLTAYSSEEHRLKGIQSGADSYITKPFSTKYLLARIVKLIEQREKLQQKFATEPGLVRPSIGFTDRDKVFLDNLHDIIEKNIENPEFKIETFAQSLGMSRTTFFRKIKGITGYPPHEYVRIMRMKKAAELLTTTDLNVQEISYKVGINDPFYLSRAFKVQFGKSPTQYRKGE